MKKILIVAISLLFIACKKETPKQYSYWKINGTEYSSNNVEMYEDKSGSGFECRDNIGFSIGFRYSKLPRSGAWPIIKTETNDPSFAEVYFYVERKIGEYYKMSISESDSIIATEHNGKVQYILAPTWFVHSLNAADSVLISGTFNEP